jgi:stage III sporulation protein AF
METVRLLVRNLVFLVILAAFMEMLLPLQGTRRIVQVIIGLFILLAVLGPIVALFRQPLPLHLELPAGDLSAGMGQQPDGQKGSAGLNSILEQGQALQQLTSAQERDAYVQRMEDQVAVICRLVPGVKEASATVTLSPSAPQQSLGVIQKVSVELQLEGQAAVRPPGAEEKAAGMAQLGANPGEAVSPLSEGAIAAQVQETVASLFGLQNDQVAVTFKH